MWSATPSRWCPSSSTSSRPARGSATASSRESAAAAVEEALAGLPDVAGRRLDERRFAVVLQGEVRHAIPVMLEVGDDLTTVTSFLLRGPRDPAAAAAMHRVLLRKNTSTRCVRFALDHDDDVVLVGRMPSATLRAEDVEAALAEVLTLGEEGFEGLVHTAYPGVFPPLPPPTRRP